MLQPLSPVEKLQIDQFVGTGLSQAGYGVNKGFVDGLVVENECEPKSGACKAINEDFKIWDFLNDFFGDSEIIYCSEAPNQCKKHKEASSTLILINEQGQS